MNTVLARLPRRSSTVISPATANAGRADGSPVDGATQWGRADVGRSVLPLAFAVTVACAQVCGCGSGGGRVPTRAHGSRAAVCTRSLLLTVLYHQCAHCVARAGDVQRRQRWSGGRVAPTRASLICCLRLVLRLALMHSSQLIRVNYITYKYHIFI